MYQPTPEQAEKDRHAAYESGVPHGQCNDFVTTLSADTQGISLDKKLN